jgi:spermidine synthase
MSWRKLETIRTAVNRLTLNSRGRAVRLSSPIGTYSVYDPRRLFTGYSWDCLSLAGKMLASPPRQILLLGMGGGTVARQCRALHPDARIDAVEIDREVIRVARQYFHLPRTQVRVVRADSVEFVSRAAAGTYDLILDDVWADDATFIKPLFAVTGYAARMRVLLRPRGAYAVNLWFKRGRGSEAQRAARLLRSQFNEVVSLRPPNGPTGVVVALAGRLGRWRSPRGMSIRARRLFR